MALTHAQPAQAIDVSPYGPRLAEKVTVALFKSEHLEVMRLVLPAGKTMPEHHLAGETTLQCLEGLLEVTTDTGRTRLAAGELMYLPAHARHGVSALEPASALLTIALRR